MPRGDQISRQWQILQILEARRMGVSVPELAAELDCNVRNIYRDMEALEIAGFPIYSEKDDGVERWKFVEGYKHKMPIPLEMTEIMALVIARDQLKAFEGTVFSGALGHAFDKIRVMLKPEANNFIDSLSNSFRVGVFGQKDYRAHKDTIELVNHAVLNHRSVMIDYRSASGEELRRKVDPYHVWFMGGTIYIVAHCHARKGLRLFVLDRIKKARSTEEKFKVPSDFSMDDFTSGRFFVTDYGKADVKIWFNKRAAVHIKERTWHPSQKIEEQNDGSIILSMEVDGVKEVMSWVMSWRSHAKILEPKELADKMVDELEAMTKMYAKRRTVGHVGRKL